LLPRASGRPDQDAIVIVTLKTGINTTFASDQPFRVHAQLTP